MELKQYQKQVIQDLTEFCNTLTQSSNPSEAFQKFWNNKGVLVKTADTVDGIDAYKDNIKGVPHVCMKVPTAGGKTFIASNSIKTIFNYLPITQTKAVIWLVPSNTILDQTLKNLSDPEHPYRQKIDSHFNSAVEVFSKEDLLMGRGFNSTSVKEQLSIMVISYDSFRSNNKDGRKAYQDNANLTSFQSNYTSEDVSLMSVIRSLNPVVIVDESHNAETDLSVEMLKDLNPSFILDLTATPRNNSNIISYVDSIELKKENMVKLPVIVYNHAEVNDVITSAYELRNSLEQKAIVEEKAGGEYIRPIVLFQAQPKGREDSETFEKIKEKLIKKGIPEEQIKIKTANKDEIKNLDLMSRDCPVRYIITVNALKEGWDCPFAYILASVANRSSRVDVEQILGRILRQPYVTKHKDPLLNMSYVFTSSAFFFDALDNITLALNKAGFSRKDFKNLNEEPELIEVEEVRPQINVVQDSNITEDILSLITEDSFEGKYTNTSKSSNTIQNIISTAIEKNEEMEEVIKSDKNRIFQVAELRSNINKIEIKDQFKEIAKDIKLPQFFKKDVALKMMEEDEFVFLTPKLLISDFNLVNQDSNINFDAISVDIYKFDLESSGRSGENTIVRKKLTSEESKYILELVENMSEDRQNDYLATRLVNDMGGMSEYDDKGLKKYVKRVIEGLNLAQRSELKANIGIYTLKIKKHIDNLANAHKSKAFKQYLDSDQIVIRPQYTLPNFINPVTQLDSIPNSLYIAEYDDLNGLELEIITKLASLENILYWHRIPERKGFFINGFINHYPDFLIVTKAGKKILMEIKGDDRDNSDTTHKIELGRAWERKAGNDYRYFMVFKGTKVEGTYLVEDILNIIKSL